VLVVVWQIKFILQHVQTLRRLIPRLHLLRLPPEPIPFLHVACAVPPPLARATDDPGLRRPMMETGVFAYAVRRRTNRAEFIESKTPLAHNVITYTLPMLDDQYLLPECKPPWWRRIPLDRWISIGAVLFAGGAAFFTFMQYRAANQQAEIARAGLALAEKSAQQQAKDVERSRIAAEKSSAAAETLAEAMKQSATASEKSAQAGLNSLELNRRALILSNLPDMTLYNSRLLRPLAAGEVPVVQSKIYNAGKGTAYRLVAQQWAELLPTRAFNYTPTGPISASDCSPGTGNLRDMTVKMSRPFTAGELKRLESGELILVEFGRASYYDKTLEKHRKYSWFWCNYYDPSASDDPAGSVRQKGTGKKASNSTPCNTKIQEFQDRQKGIKGHGNATSRKRQWGAKRLARQPLAGSEFAKRADDRRTR
jgi:hypothetical protein